MKTCSPRSLSVFSFLLRTTSLALFTISAQGPLAHGIDRVSPKDRYILLNKTPVVPESPPLTATSRLVTRTRPSRAALASEFRSGVVVSWNGEARLLVAKSQTPPPKASRVYALLSVGQFDTTEAASALQNVSIPAAASEVSFRVLSALYPEHKRELRVKHRRALRYAFAVKNDSPSALARARALALIVAKQVLRRAETDGADASWQGKIPTGAGYWRSSLSPAVPPLLPLWGSVRPWFLSSGSELRPPPPPAFDSPEFKAALDEVKSYALTRTIEQAAIAEFWADGAGTATPPGHWNQIATDFLIAARSHERRAAAVLAALNMAMMDAGICCWDAKYAYWLIRPSQADPSIDLAVPLPNFPSYTSGHATFSGAAATVLGAAFPGLSSYFSSMAEEAAVSRLYGGIHYRFDSDLGLQGGRLVGTRAASWLQKKLG